jgi:hypothetical protein
MSALLDMIAKQLSSSNMQTIGNQLGLDASTTQQAIAHSLPSLLSGIAQHADSSAQAAQDLHNAVSQASSDSTQVINLSQTQPAKATLPTDLMQKIAGNQATIDQIAANSGLPASQIQKLLPMLAPMVMGAMGQAKQQQGLNPASLTQMLKDTESHIAQNVSPKAQKVLQFAGEHKGQIETAAMAGGAFLLGRLFSKRK